MKRTATSLPVPRASSALRRAASAGLVLGLLLVLSGDLARTQAVEIGQDPLEILDLQTKPNVVLLIDSSTSMRAPVPTSGQILTNHPASRFSLAKQAARQIVVDNQERVQFELGQYGYQNLSANGSTYTYVGGCSTDATYPTYPGGPTSYAACNTLYTSFSVVYNGTTGITADSGLDLDNNVTGGDNTRYYDLTSTKFYNGTTVVVDTSGNVTSRDMTPAGDATRAWVDIKETSSGTPARFYFAGPTSAYGSSVNCDGYLQVVSLMPCSAGVTQIDTIGPHLDPEILVSDGVIKHRTTGATIVNEGDTFNTGTLLNAQGGLKATSYTPIADSLQDIKGLFTTLWNDTLRHEPIKRRTYVIVVTDGDDTCNNGSANGGTADGRAKSTAYWAERLHTQIDANPESAVETMIVVFGPQALDTTSMGYADWAAAAGSGLDLADDGADAWTQSTTDINNAVTACTTCRRAFAASTLDELTAALQATISQVASSGTFSAAGSVTDNVFELVKSVQGTSSCPSNDCDADNPDTRWTTQVPVTFTSTFTMPEFAGHLIAFRASSSGDTAITAWGWDSSSGDAGRKLRDQVWNGTAASPGGIGQSTPRTYSQMAGTNVNTTPPFTPYASGGNALLKRRIFTNPSSLAGAPSNGVFPYATGLETEDRTNGSPAQRPYLLWPNNGDESCSPNSSVFCTADSRLDDELGIAYTELADDAARFTQLQTEFGACSNVPTGATGAAGDCLSGVDSTRLAAARREARQIILAYMAGARVQRDSSGLVQRQTANDGYGNPYQLLYVARSWMLADSTAPGAVVVPPLETTPPANFNRTPYKFARDGPRNTSDMSPDTSADYVDQGFGLRNPDRDATTAVPDTRVHLKPRMTVFYLPAHDGLHALRAGPNCSTTAVPPTTCGEWGGEELWMYLPYDQLGKLKPLMQTQTRQNHTYVMGSAPRFGDVWVPTTGAVYNPGSVAPPAGGKWRTMLFVGRGRGGSHYTALDITSPGSYRRNALETNLPGIIWSRGNPDTQDGTDGGTLNHTAADRAAYSGMGQTWSVPALARVHARAADGATPGVNITVRRPEGVEYVVFAGSGYGIGSQGTTLYKLDAINGDVVGAHDVGDRSGLGFENALVASPAAFNGTQLQAATIMSHPSEGTVDKVYLGDIHGRLWRFFADGTAPDLFKDAGSDQPIGVAAALANHKCESCTGPKPHVYIESGYDSRVGSPVTPPFRIWGLRDDGDTAVATDLFTIDFPNTAPDFRPGFRGTSQPATAFECAVPLNADGNCPTGNERMRAFFVGTMFIPAEEQCFSSFKSILYAVGAETGDAAYDFSASGDDRAIVFENQRLAGVRVAGGALILDKGIDASTAPPAPPPAQVVTPVVPDVKQVFILGTKPFTNICR